MLMQRMKWFVAALVLGLAASSAQGQTTYTWQDLGTAWGTAGNWSPSGPPNNILTDIAAFGPKATITNQPDISTNSFSVLGITIDDSLAGKWNLAGTTGVLSIGTSGLTLTGSGTSTSTANLRIAAAQTWSLASGTTFQQNSGLSGFYGLTKSSSGTLILDSVNTSPSTFMGGFTISGGTLQAGSATNNAASQVLRSNAVNLSSGTSLTTVGTTIDLRVGQLSGSGSVTPATGGAVNELVRADSNFSGAITTTGGLNLRGANGTTQTFNGNLTGLTGTVGVNSGATFKLSGTGDSTSGVLASTSLTTRGGNFSLDSSAGNTSAAAGRIADTAGITLGGGTFALIGNSAGTSETVGAFNMNSGSSTISVTNNGGTGAVLAFTDSGSLRDATNGTINFVGAGTGTLGSSGNNPRITFSGSINTNTTNGALANTSSATAATIGWARVNGTSWAGIGANGIVALAETARNSTTLSSAAAWELTTFTPSQTTTTLTAALGTGTTPLLLKVTPSATGQSLASGGFDVNAAAVMLAGTTDFSISGVGNLFGTATSTRYVYVTDANTTLSVSQSVAGTANPVVKSGPGTVFLNGSSNQLAFSTVQNVNIIEGTLRGTTTTLGGSASSGGAFTNVNLFGGVLEISGGGTLTRALGTNTVVGTASGGAIKWDNNNSNARGDGGFSAIGANATVTLVTAIGGATAATPNWNDVGFVQNGYALVFGSTKADSRIDFTNSFGLDSGVATSNYFAREIRVVDNPGSTTDVTRLSGVISGSAFADLLKTGAGTLELTNTNTFSGGVLVNEGTLLIGSNSALGSSAYVLVGGNGGSNNASLLTNGAFTTARDITVISGNTGTITLGGNTDNNSTFSGKVELQKDVTLTSVTTGANTTTFSGVFSGAGSVTKSGTGTVTLSAANAYTGTTTISAGTLQLGIANALPATAVSVTGTLARNGFNDTITTLGLTGGTVSGSGTLTLGGTVTSTGTSSVSGGTLALGANRTVDVSGQLTVGDTITGATFSLTKTSAGTLILSSGSNSYSGGTTISAGTLQLGANNAVPNNALSVTGTLARNGFNDTITTLGFTGGTVSGSGTLTLGGTVTSTGTSSISGGTLALGANRTFNVTNTLTVGDAITGSGFSLTKTGSGTLALSSSSNSYDGGTNVSAGTLQLGASNVLPDFAVSVTGTLDRNTFSDTIGTLSLTGGTVSNSGTLTLGGTLTSTGNSTVTAGTLALGGNRTVDVTNTLSIEDVVAGVGNTLTKTGAGTLVLSNTNTYSGGTNINNGIVDVTTNKALGSGAGTAVVASGAVLQLDGVNYFTSQALTINGTGTGSGALVNIGTSTFAGPITAASNATINAGGGILNLSGGLSKNGTTLTIAGGGNVNITGTGISGANANSDLVIDGTVVSLAAASTYNGPTTVQNGGTLKLAASNVLPTSPVTNLTVNASTFDRNSFSDQIGSLTLAGGSVSGTGTLTLNDVVTSTGTSTISGGTLALGANRTFDVTNSLVVADAITGSGFALTKVGTGTLALNSASNSYSGGTSVNAGTLQLGNSNVLPNFAVTVAGTLDRNGNSDTIGALTLSGGTVSGSGTLTLGGTVTSTGTSSISGGTLALGANRTFDVTNTLTVGDTVTGTGFSLTKGGTGIMVLSDPGNSYSGGTAIDAGTLRLGANDVLPNFAVSVTGTLDRNGNSDTIGALTLAGGTVSGAGTLTLGGNVTSTGTSTISGGTLALGADRTFDVTSTLTIGDAITGGGNVLTKTGSGTLELSGTNSFSGTVINAGTVKIDAGASVVGTIDVNSTGVLGGSGQFAGLTINSGGTLAPGNSPGAISGTGATLMGGGAFQFQMNDATGVAGPTGLQTGWDLLVLTNTLTLDPSVTASTPFVVHLQTLTPPSPPDTLGPASNFNAATSYTWNFITYANFVGSFAANKFSVDASGFGNSFTGTFSVGQSGNALYLAYNAPISAVPEPGSLLLCGIAAAGMGYRRWRKRRQAASGDVGAAASGDVGAAASGDVGAAASPEGA